MFSFGQQQQQQQQPGGLFGQPAATPGGLFGQPASTPQQGGLFGQTASTPQQGGLFGSTAATPQQGGLFGSTAASPASGGLFGQAQPAATGGMFGQAQQPVATGGLFGQPQQAATGQFGQQPATGLFGQQQPAQQGGMFGQQQPQQGGMFGQQQPQGMFGQQQQPAAGMFGSQPQPSPFTSVAPSPFGGTSVAPSPFGGTSAFGGAATGTSGSKYQTTRDTELNMKLVSITAMDAYKAKSFEELRWEDYQRNSATPATSTQFGQQATSTPFGQPASTPFGQQNQFGAASPQPGGMFGSTQQTNGGLFGSSTPQQPAQSSGLFGSTTPGQTGGLFGSTQPAAQSGGLFGSAQPATQSGGLFGSTQPTSGGLFGSSQPAAQSGGLFGSTQPAAQSGGLFGSTQPAAQSGGLFGSTQPAAQSGGLFGSTQPAAQSGGLFGSTPAQSGGLFGSTQPAAQSGGLFGSIQPAASTGGLFGATQPAQSGGGLFGSTTQSGGGLFGSTQPAAQSGGLFGSTQPAATGGLFGSSQPASGGLFGSTQPAQSGGGLFGSTQPAAQSGGLFGSSQPSGGLFGSTTPQSGGLFGSTQSASGGLFGSTQPATGGLFGSAQPAQSSLFGSAQPAQSSAPLGSGLGFAQGNLFGSSPVAVPPAAANPNAAPRPTGIVLNKALDKDSLSAFLWKDGKPNTPKKTVLPAIGSAETRSFVPHETEKKPVLPAVHDAGSPEKAVYPEISEEPLRLAPLRPKIIYTTPTKLAAKVTSLKSVLPHSSNHNIWTKPSFEAMSGMTETELSKIEHFQIGHYGIGSVTWPGLTDVRFIDIDEIIVFKKGSVTLFPDEDLKPPVGSGLNKTAIIELTVKPKNYELAKKHQERYETEMKKLTESNGAEFLSYDLETWRFRVEHFSTWGIDEMQWDIIDVSEVKKEGKKTNQKNDLSLFSRLEQDIYTDDEDFEMESDSTGRSSALEEEPIGALAVAPPTRMELIKMGWNLKVCDLFLNQSFRVCFAPNSACWFPRHPVVFNQHTLSNEKMFVADEPFIDMEPLLSLVVNSRGEELLERILDSQTISTKTKSIFVLLKSLIQKDNVVEDINSEKFNAWLSRVNCDKIRSDPLLSFSPAAALTSREYTPSAARQLMSSGNPRLALAVAAATANETSRLMMKEQFSRVEAKNNEKIQQVYQVLGGQCLEDHLDWRGQLALRYWFCEGDMSGFDPPADSIEWLLIRSVVLKDSTDLIRSMHGVLVFVVQLIVDNEPNYHVAKNVADNILSNNINWQWAPLVLSSLPGAGKLIADIIARHINEDCSLIEEWKLASREELVAAKAVALISGGQVDDGKELMKRNGMTKQTKGLISMLPV